MSSSHDIYAVADVFACIIDSEFHHFVIGVVDTFHCDAGLVLIVIHHQLFHGHVV
jgi:hypothetical protein